MPELKKEQKEAVFHDDGNILVSASAGSGKTFVMIERLIRLICEGKAKVREILAATFTEAAAEEMRERLKKALAEKIEQGETRLAEELTDVYSADICTLHAFCGRLIRSYFFVAGVSPDYKIADEDLASELKTEALNKAFKEIYLSHDKELLKLCDRYKKKRADGALKDMVLSLYEYCDSEKDPQELYLKTLSFYTEEGFERVKKEYERYLFKALKPIKNKLIYADNGFSRTGLEKGKAFTDELLSVALTVEENGLYSVKTAIDRIPNSPFRGKTEEQNLEYKAAAIESRDDMKKLFTRIASNLKSEEEDKSRIKELAEHTRALFKLADRFAELYAESKRAENVLDFGDLEKFALKVLSDEQALKAVKERYKYIFVDEYQDVNGIQEEIISRITRGNAFAVGDVKQSIYGFRGCRPEIFTDKARGMRERGEKTVLLNHNFRSSDKVIETVNEIFSYSMTEEFFGENYKESSMLVSGGVYADGGDGRAELHLFKTESESREKEKPRVYDILEEIKREGTEEKTDISALIADIVRGELEKEYYSSKEKKFKRVTYSDIVVLTRNRNGAYVEKLVSGLVKRGVPVASEVKQNVCDRPEIAVLINALKLIDCFIDDIPLVSVLKSQIGGFTEEELAAVALYYSENASGSRGGFYDAFDFYLKNAETELKNRLVQFKGYFDKIRFLSDYLGAEGSLEKLILDSDYESFLLAETGGEKKIRRVRRFVSLAGSGKNYTVSEFLRKIECGGDAFCVSECAGEDNVRIMTIHASKGLEFPVVIVCGLERKANARDESGDLLSDRELGFAVRYYDDEDRSCSETPFRGLIKEKLRENRMKEELRLFYVATTRAAYALHLTFEGKEDKRKSEFTGADCFLDYVPNSVAVTEHEASEFGAAELVREPRKILVGKKDEELISEMKKNFSFVYPYEKACSLPLKTAVTALLKENFLTDTENFVEKTADTTDKNKGIIAHAIMQNIDFNRIEEFDSQLKELIKKGILSEEEISSVNTERLKNALTSKLFGRLKEYSLYREKSFIVAAAAGELYGEEYADTDEKVVMQGVIDLLAVKDKSVAVIDYKYSRAAAEKLVERYKKQLDLYAQSAAKLLGKEIESETIVNLFSGEVIKIR